MRRPSPDSEQGFVLVGLVWLLLLGTAIVGLLMLRAHAQAQDASVEGQILQQRLDLDSANEMVIADLLVRGAASSWARLPANGTLQIGDAAIDVRITGEEGLLDLNDGDLALIHHALQGLGYAPAARNAFESGLAARRSRGRIQLEAEAASLLAPLVVAGPSAGECLADLFTLASARSKPNESRVPAALAAALGLAPVAEPALLHGGESIRIVVINQRGATLTSVLRILGSGKHPVEVSARHFGRTCAGQTKSLRNVPQNSGAIT